MAEADKKIKVRIPVLPATMRQVGALEAMQQAAAGMAAAPPYPHASAMQQQQMNEHRNRQLEAMGQNVAAQIDRNIMKNFVPEIWSKKLLESYKDNVILGNLGGHSVPYKPDPPPMPCPLSKQIIMDELQELIAMYPDKHFSEIIRELPLPDGDTMLAHEVTKQVRSLKDEKDNPS